MAAASDKARGEISSVRDTVESIWVAILLALVLRAFLVEAFVIPTGSMAPRLMGEHWDLVCPACGYEYAFGVAAAGSTSAGAGQLRQLDKSQRYHPPNAHCPNCGKPYDGSREYVGSGDRVLVLKYLYRFSPPQPFDVVVFRNPQNNRENYIKRLIGLPGETIELLHGDVFVSETPSAPRRIRRKPPVAQEAMWQVVFDNDYQIDPGFCRQSRCPKWVATPREEDWEVDTYHRRWTFKGGSGGALVFDADPAVFLPHYGYNSPESEAAANGETDVCTDLKLAVMFTPAEPSSSVALVLTSMENRFRAELSADGTASLLYQAFGWPADRWDQWGIVRRAAMAPGRGYQLALMNVDLSVKVAIDGQIVLDVTDRYPETYESIKRRLQQAQHRPIPTPQAQVYVWGGPCELSHISLMRDVYYTNPRLAGPVPGPLGDFARRLHRAGLANVAKGAPGWGTTGNPITLAKHDDNPDLDEFFMLGDNSPQSYDSRAWTAAAPTLRLYNGDVAIYQLGTVPRYNLIGKAFCVYWPSAFRLPGLPGLPIVPNFGKMRFIR